MRIFLIVVLVLGLIFGVALTSILAQPHNNIAPVPPVGVAIISQENDWNLQRETIRAGQFTFARLPITDGFGNNPQMVDDLVADEVQAIALAYEGCPLTPLGFEIDFIARGYQAKVVQYPDIQFYLEIGNEPDIFCTTETPASYRDKLHQLRDHITQTNGYANLRKVAGLGFSPAFNRELLADGSIFAAFDAVAYHLYAHESFGDIADTWDYWKNDLAVVGEPILLTEVGINGDIGEHDKAIRYRAFALQQPPTTEAIAFWTVDPAYRETQWITPQMAHIMAGNGVSVESCAITGYCIEPIFQNFYVQNGLDLGDEGISYRESLLLFGHPLSDSYRDPNTGHLIQVFERAVIEWHPEHQPPYDILLRRLGAEWTP